MNITSCELLINVFTKKKNHEYTAHYLKKKDVFIVAGTEDN